MAEEIRVSPDTAEFFRFVVESATDFAIISMDSRRKVTSWNTGAERLLGFAEAEILGQTADTIFTPEDREAGIPEVEVQQALASGRGEDERWTLRKDGSRFWASGLLMPLADRDLGFVKIFRDRTRQHQAEQRQKESEEHFRLLSTNTAQLVFLARSDGSRTWSSPQWSEFTGLSAEQSEGFGWLAAVHPEDRHITHEAIVSAITAGTLYVEHRIRRASDGSFRWHQTRSQPPRLADLDWVGAMTDVDDLRTMKDRQQVLMRELQHRSKNLLTVVQAIANQTARASQSLATFVDDFSGRLQALGRVQGLISQTDREVALQELVSAELAALGGAYDSRVAISGPPVFLESGAAQTLALALHELATNAVKYGALARQSGHLDIHWSEESRRGLSSVVLEWKERGVPMSGGRHRRGYGTELITRALPAQLGAETVLEFTADGVRCVINVPLHDAGQ